MQAAGRTPAGAGSTAGKFLDLWGWNRDAMTIP